MTTPKIWRLTQAAVLGMLLCLAILAYTHSTPASSTSEELLSNGGFEIEDSETGGFVNYGGGDNHWIALGWDRWWLQGSHLSVPEFDDYRAGMTPKSLLFEGKHTQLYHKWGAEYVAGIYQVIYHLTPCVPYEFTMWARNHAEHSYIHPHTKIGLDPQGVRLTSDPHWDYCDIPALPSRVVWSEEQSELFVWEELQVTAEPVADRLTAILYAAPAPEGGQPYDAYYNTAWDSGSIQRTTFPNNHLPEPDSWENSSYITNVTTSLLTDTLHIDWETPETPASTQVWYRLSHPISTTPEVLTYTTYFPYVASGREFNYTPMDLTPKVQHSAQISDLQSGDELEIWVLSRRPLTNRCRTEVYGPLNVTIP
jgi:hypothetical protein